MDISFVIYLSLRDKTEHSSSHFYVTHLFTLDHEPSLLHNAGWWRPSVSDDENVTRKHVKGNVDPSLNMIKTKNKDNSMV